MHEKTPGNPFFAIQFLSVLREEQLLRFDPPNGTWNWDLERIRTQGYTDNVVDLMAGKLHRLADRTQEALKQLACLGNEADFATLSLLRGESEDALCVSLWEALHAGYVIRLKNGYKFLHDRVQEAAYSLIPEVDRPATHLRIGRALAAHTAHEQIEEKVFEIVNQLNFGIELITDSEERERIAKFNLIAGIRAQNSTAYASALRYFNAGCELLAANSCQIECSVAATGKPAASSLAGREATLRPSTARYALTFALELHVAQCEYLTGALDAAEERLSHLSVYAADLADFAAVTAARLDVYTTQDRGDRAVEVCLDYLQRVGVDWSPHPSEEEVRKEYELLWRGIGERTIESLLDLPCRRLSARLMRTVLSRTRLSRVNGRRRSTKHADSTGSRSPTCGMRGTAICAGEPTAKCASSTNCTRSFERNRRRSVLLPPSRLRSNTWIWIR